MDLLEPLLTSDDVANYMKVDVVTVRRLVNRGELAAYRIGGEYRFKANDIREYLERQYLPAQLFAAGDLDKLIGQAFGKFTKRAKQTLLLAAEEARSFKRAQVGPEHILLGLIREGEGVAGRVLDQLGISLDRAVQAVEATSGMGQAPDQIVQDSDDESKRVISGAVNEAKQLKHHFIGTEHLLLALTHDGEGTAPRALEQLGVSTSAVRDAVLQMLKEGPR